MTARLVGSQQTNGTGGNGGTFMIPAGPSAGTSISSGGSGTTYGSWTELSAAVSADIFLVGAIVYQTTGNLTTYTVLDVGLGAGGSEVSAGEYPMPPYRSAAGAREAPVWFPDKIPVGSGVRVAGRLVDSFAAIAYNVKLIAINRADVVNQG